MMLLYDVINVGYCRANKESKNECNNRLQRQCLHVQIWEFSVDSGGKIDQTYPNVHGIKHTQEREAPADAVNNDTLASRGKLVDDKSK